MYDLLQRFENRTIPVEGPVTFSWGDLMALAKQNGRGLASYGPFDCRYGRRARFDASYTQYQRF
jgi:hypothetical protein